MQLENIIDVLIIGAGVAGLAAWRELHSAGLHVVVLEARDRLGGRILTDRSTQSPIELGAEFVHGKPKATWSILEAARLETVESSDRRIIIDKSILHPDAKFWEIIQRISGQIAPGQEISYDRFLASVNASPFEKLVAKSYVEGFNAARTDLISASFVAMADRTAAEIEGDRQFRLRKGYGSLVHWLAAGLPRESLQLRTEVREIHWQRGQVNVVADTPSGGRVFPAARIVITVPLGVLQAAAGARGAIRFLPPLLQKEAALRHLEMGHVMKLAIYFRERFWENRGRFGLAISFDEELPTWWTQEPLTSNVLTGWSGGPKAQRLINLSPDELLQRAIDCLSRIFLRNRNWLHERVETILYHNWTNDPFSRGAYSYPKPGGLEAARALAEPVGDTIYFAGEATDFQGASGTVHAALQSGTSTARKIAGRQ